MISNTANKENDLALSGTTESMDANYITFSRPFLPKHITDEHMNKESQTSPKKNRVLKGSRNEVI